MNTETTVPSDKFKQDMKNLASDLDEIVRATDFHARSHR